MLGLQEQHALARVFGSAGGLFGRDDEQLVFSAVADAGLGPKVLVSIDSMGWRAPPLQDPACHPAHALHRLPMRQAAGWSPHHKRTHSSCALPPPTAAHAHFMRAAGPPLLLSTPCPPWLKVEGVTATAARESWCTGVLEDSDCPLPSITSAAVLLCRSSARTCGQGSSPQAQAMTAQDGSSLGCHFALLCPAATTALTATAPMSQAKRLRQHAVPGAGLLRERAY